jgi:hypothetical protein
LMPPVSADFSSNTWQQQGRHRARHWG